MNKVRARVAVVVVALLSAAGIFLGTTPAFATSCVTSDKFGVCFPANGLQLEQVNNNVWNWNDSHVSSWSQTLTASIATQWYAVANIANSSNDVISYPETSLQFYQSSKPISSWNNIISSWHAGLPGVPQPGDKYEAAYDLWFDAGPGQAGSKEVMIWTDNHGQTPGGTDHGNWTDPTYNRSYEVWWDDTQSPVKTVWFVADTNSHTGSVDIWDAALTARAAAWPGDDFYNIQFDYGFEDVNSSGQSAGGNQKFNLAGLSWTMN